MGYFSRLLCLPFLFASLLPVGCSSDDGCDTVGNNASTVHIVAQSTGKDVCDATVTLSNVTGDESLTRSPPPDDAGLPTTCEYRGFGRGAGTYHLVVTRPNSSATLLDIQSSGSTCGGSGQTYTVTVP